MRRQRRIRLAWFAAVMAAAMALTACAGKGNDAGDERNDGNAAQNETSQHETTPQNGGQPDGGKDEGQAEVREGSGFYVGQVDPHSIEIDVDGTPTVFQLGEGIADVLDGLHPNDPVSFKFTEQPVESDPSVKVLTIIELARSDRTGAGAEDLPDTRQIEVLLEGMPEVREAVKAVGNGYAIYVFPQFTFDPGTNRMSMDVDPDYYVEIGKLPAGFSRDEVRAEGEAWVKESAGTVEEWTGDNIYEPMRDADLYLTGQKAGLTRTFVVKSISGADFVLKFNQPQREASEGFLPLAFASVNTIVNLSS